MTEAGWYEDPERHGRGRRYWDGGQWTEHYEHPAPAAQAAPVTPAPQPVVQQQAPAQQLPPAGWKDDPEGGPGMRYWDGNQWTDHYHPPREASTGQQAAAAATPAASAFKPAEAQPAPAASPAKSSSLDETQLDVRGYQGGRADETPAAAPEPAASPTPAAATPEPAAAPEPAAEPVSDGPDLSVDYGTDGEPTTCDSCGAKIRTSHKFCPACGVTQEGAGT